MTLTQELGLIHYPDEDEDIEFVEYTIEEGKKGIEKLKNWIRENCGGQCE